MNFIEELVKKYEGTYSEESNRGINFPSGHYTFHPQKGIVEIDGTKISLSINAVGGAAQTTEPYRIILYLDKDYNTKLEIFPKTNLKKLLEFIIPSNGLELPKQIKKQFSFKGNMPLMQELLSDRSFCENITGEKVYIMIRKKHPKSIMLTPAHGIADLQQFEKFLLILKQIESKIKSSA